MAEQQPAILVKKVIEEGGHGHHGGAWKVAYADFVTAMMAFFLMLWLLSTSDEQTLQGLANYFSEAAPSDATPGGLGGILEGVSALSDEIVIPSTTSPFSMEARIPLAEAREEEPDPFELDLALQVGSEGEEVDGQIADETFAEEKQRREEEQFEEAKTALLDAMNSSPELAEFAENIIIDQTPEGLRIQIVDRAQQAMFPSGNAVMYEHTKKLLATVINATKALDQKVSIRGHTDAVPYAAGADYDNWRLSSDRANATRMALIDGGFDPLRIADVIGKAASDPLYLADPKDPRNRRISLVLLREQPIDDEATE